MPIRYGPLDHLIKDIETIENVQRRATNLIPGFRDLSYEGRLRVLNLPTLCFRRLRGDMIEMFKKMSGKYDPKVTLCNFIQLNKLDTRGHNKKVFQILFQAEQMQILFLQIEVLTIGIICQQAL